MSSVEEHNRELLKRHGIHTDVEWQPGDFYSESVVHRGLNLLEALVQGLVRLEGNEKPTTKAEHKALEAELKQFRIDYWRIHPWKLPDSDEEDEIVDAIVLHAANIFRTAMIGVPPEVRYPDRKVQPFNWEHKQHGKRD